jgi:plastocyanin
MPRMTRGRVVIAGVAAAFAVSACAGKSPQANLINGKTKFTDQCARCHTLARANATGVVGPNLDAAFAQSRADGLGQSTFEGIVHQWILHPNRNPQLDPETGKPAAQMPAGIFKGEDARDVAAYVASAVGKPGKDKGRLATVGAQKAEGTATEKNGTLDIPVAAAGLAYKFADATAEAGSVKITSENPQSTGHDIAIEGNGVAQKGEVVTKGGTSTFTVDLKPGTYTFYCSVPGHREGGMQGKLTVK